MTGPSLEELLSAYARSIGSHVSMEGVESSGYIFLSLEHEVQMKVAPRKRGLRYLEYTDTARHLRLDSPLIAYLAGQCSGPLTVDVPLVGAPESLTPQLAYMPVKVRIGDETSTADVFTADGPLHYRFDGPLGLADLTGAVRDALLLAETADEMECQGTHDQHYGMSQGAGGIAADVMKLRYKICSTCLSHMEDMGFPMAPPVPEGWE